MPIQTIDEYIKSLDPQWRPLAQEMRELIQLHAPEATEKIAYGLATFALNGNLVHYAVQKKHMGFYPTPSGISAFSDQFDLAGYKYSKGAVQFPLTEPMPWELIGAIVDFRVAEQE